MNEVADITQGARTLLARTLWRIETGLQEPLSLFHLASAEGVTPFHLSRAFSLALGISPMAYVKARRLSEAARLLRNSEARIIDVAFSSGYDSHEGFSRSFRDHFGVSPRAWRNTPDIRLTLQEAIIMPTTQHPTLTPRFETRPQVRLAGLARRYTLEARAKIPKQWEEFATEHGAAVMGIETFGACFDFDDGSFSYLCGFIDDGRIDSERLDHVVLPAGDYAVFDHAAHVSTISDTWSAIFEAWMPDANVTPGEGPEFEHYAKDFDPEEPGRVSVCIPVQRKG